MYSFYQLSWFQFMLLKCQGYNYNSIYPTEMKNVYENWQSSLQNYFNLLLYSIKKAVGIYISTIWVQGNSISPFVLLATVWRARCIIIRGCNFLNVLGRVGTKDHNQRCIYLVFPTKVNTPFPRRRRRRHKTYFNPWFIWAFVRKMRKLELVVNPQWLE